MDLALYNLQWLICHKTKPNKTKSNQTKSKSLTILYRSNTHTNASPVSTCWSIDLYQHPKRLYVFTPFLCREQDVIIVEY